MTDDYFEPFSYGASISTFLSSYMYTTWKVGPREAIANAIDEYKDPVTEKRPHYNEIYVELDSLRRTLSIEDYARGIQDLIKFKMMGGATTSKTVGATISTRNNPNPSIIGLFHVGKASFPKMSTMKEGFPVRFYSNNGIDGVELPFKLRGEELGWGKEYNMRAQDFKEKPTLGLRVKVFDVVDDLTSITIVKNLIARDFGILISRGLKIFIRDVGKTNHTEWERIYKPPGLHTDNERKLSLQMANKFMTHQLDKTEDKPKEPMNLDLYKNHVYIKSIHVPFKVTGWINCDWLELNGPRNDFQDNDILEQVMNVLNKYLYANFERDSKPRSNKITGMKDMCDLMRKIVEVLPQVFPNMPINLMGPLDKSSQTRGIVHNEPTLKEEGAWEKEENMLLVDKASDPNGGIIKTIGNGTKGGGEPGTIGGEGNNTGAVEGGDHTIIRKVDKSKRPNTDNIKPTMEIKPEDLGSTKPVTYMVNPSLMILNTSRQSVLTLLEMGIVHRLAILGPFFAEAAAEFMTRAQPNPITIEEYRAHVSDIYSRIM